MTQEEQKTSEFGRGLTYCLGLFLAHAEVDAYPKELRVNRGMYWFNGASDHLFELQIPNTLPKELQERIAMFRNDVLEKGHGMKMLERHTEKDISEAIHEAKMLLLLIDKAHGIDAIESDYP